MKRFLNDYLELMKQSVEFSKKHWLGILVMYLVIITSIYISLIIVAYLDKIKSMIKKIFKKDTDDTVDEESE